MKTTLAGLAAATFLAVVGSQPAAAMPMANVDHVQSAANSNIINVRTRHHARRYYRRHYRYYRPRYGYVGPRYYYGGYPYRYYPYPYQYYGPGFGVRIGPFGFGVW